MNRHGLSGESVLFALHSQVRSGTDDLTLLVFSSKPCWMTQSSCAPSFQYPFAVFVTAVRVGAQAVAAARLAAVE